MGSYIPLHQGYLLQTCMYGCIQVAYHGFGTVVKPEKMVAGHGTPLTQAVQHVLANTSFKVSAV